MFGKKTWITTDQDFVGDQKLIGFTRKMTLMNSLAWPSQGKPMRYIFCSLEIKHIDYLNIPSNESTTYYYLFTVTRLLPATKGRTNKNTVFRCAVASLYEVGRPRHTASE